MVVTPGAPSSISPFAGSTTTGSYSISWGAYTGSVKSADVFYELQESSTTAFTSVTTVYSGTARSAGLSKGALGDWYYRVRACNQDGSVKECSAWEARAHEIITGTGGGGGPQVIIGGGGDIPVPPPGTIGAAIPAVKPIAIEQDASSQVALAKVKPAVRHSVKGRNPAFAQLASANSSSVRVRPRFAPPVYKAWAKAHLQAASGTSTVVRFAVQHVYTANGYLWQLVSPFNPGRVYWKVNEFGGGGGTADAVTMNYYEHGMDARGNVVESFYGAGGTSTAIKSHAGYDPNSGYLRDLQSTNNSNGTVYQNLAYQWYAIGNLYNRTANVSVANANTLSETFGYDLHNRLLSSSVTNGVGSPTPLTEAYDVVGDITCKSDVTGAACTPGSGGYSYGGSGAGPHAVTSAGGNTYGYDADGNMTSRSVTVNTDSGPVSSTQVIAWNSDNLPTCISDASDGTCTGTSNYSKFAYAPDKHRYMQAAMNGGSSETTFYVGGLEIVMDSTGTQYRHTISTYGKPVLLETLGNTTAGAPQEGRHYLLNDHLDSVETVVNDGDGTVEPKESFDAFGQRRDGASWNGPMASTDLANARKVTHHGFTHHEHLDNLAGLVHANGRVLDSVTGRFLSVDPLYQAPTNSQSINPYSYVMNNSLSLVDPTGYASTPDSTNIAESGSGGHPMAPIQDPQGDTSVTLDFGSEGGVGGEGGRDINGNLIITSLDAMQPGDAVVTANGNIDIKNADGTFTQLGGNGATTGNTDPGSTVQAGAGAGFNQSASAEIGSSVTVGSVSLTNTDTLKNSISAALGDMGTNGAKGWPVDSNQVCDPAVGGTRSLDKPASIVFDGREDDEGTYKIFFLKMKDGNGNDLVGSQYGINEHIWKDEAHTIKDPNINSSTGTYEPMTSDGKFMDYVGYGPPKPGQPRQTSFTRYQTFTVTDGVGCYELTTELKHVTTVSGSSYQNEDTYDKH